MKLPMMTAMQASALCVLLLMLNAGVGYAQTIKSKPATAAAPTAVSQGSVHPASKPPAGLPADWDRKIPIAASSKLVSTKEEKGTRHVVFSATGDFDELIAFYYNGLMAAGFTRSGAAKLPVRHMYKLVFNSAAAPDQSLTIAPGKTPNSYSVEFTYPIAGSAAAADHKASTPLATPPANPPSTRKK